MTKSRHGWVTHLLSSVGFSIIAISALQIVATPVPAGAAPPPDQARAATEGPRLAAPSLLRERAKTTEEGGFDRHTRRTVTDVLGFASAAGNEHR
jgi:hypothetical protein